MDETSENSYMNERVVYFHVGVMESKAIKSSKESRVDDYGVVENAVTRGRFKEGSTNGERREDFTRRRIVNREHENTAVGG